MDGGAVDPSAMRQGQRAIVRLTGRVASDRSVLTVVDDALPAGWEIESTLTPEDAQGASSSGDDGEEGGGDGESGGGDAKPKAGPFAFHSMAHAWTNGKNPEKSGVSAVPCEHSYGDGRSRRSGGKGGMAAPSWKPAQSGR